MTLIATLPAGTYRVTITTPAALLPCDVRKGALGGRARSDEAVVWANHGDVCHRGARSDVYMRVPRATSGMVDFNGRPGAVIVLDGAETLRPHAGSQCFDVATNRGPMVCSKVMAVMPIDKAEPHMFRTGAAFWYDVESTEPVCITYDDLVLAVGDLRIDQKADYALVHSGFVIAPGSDAFDLLKPDCASPRIQTIVTRDMITALETMGPGPRAIAAYALDCMDRFGQCTLHYGVDAGPGLPADLDVHFSSPRLPGVVRKGTALHDLLKPRLEGDRIWVDDIGDDVLRQVRAIGGEEADMVVDIIKYSRKQGDTNAVFTPCID